MQGISALPVLLQSLVTQRGRQTVGAQQGRQ
jgi:hypothetical protein